VDAQTAIPIDMPDSEPPVERPEGPPPQPIDLAQFLTHWESLALPELVVMPSQRKLADMARCGEPIVIGRTLIRVEKLSGTRRASLHDLQEAARDLAALRGADIRQFTTMSVVEGGWQADLIKTLEDGRRRSEDAGRKVPPYGGNWYWIRQWGCLDLSQVAQHDGRQWIISSAYAPTVEACRKLQAAIKTERDRCVRCGGIVEDFQTDSIATAHGWEGRCPTCRTAHTGALIAYIGHLRDIPYSRVRDLRIEPAHTYRCVVCSQPAAVSDHCHEHDIVRGPLCRHCNLHDGWLGSPFFQGAPQPPIKHATRCETCVQHEPRPELRARLISLQMRRTRGEPATLGRVVRRCAQRQDNGRDERAKCVRTL
jgi:Recombination endonuclease VII